MAQFLKPKERLGMGKSHWILDSPLARRSLNGTVERDTVKGSLWRPAKKERKSTITTCTKSMWSTKPAKLRKKVI